MTTPENPRNFRRIRDAAPFALAGLGFPLPTSRVSLGTSVPLRLLALTAMTWGSLWLSACDCGGTTARPCRSSSQCEAGQMCVSGMCSGRPTTGGRDGGQEPDAFVPMVGGDCTASPPVPADEVCNGRDDDCDDIADEGVTNSCGTCDPACTGSRAGARVLGIHRKNRAAKAGL